MPKVDLVIRNGEVVTGEGSLGVQAIGIMGETISHIAGDLAGDLEIDATGKLVLPGGLDAHVHLSYPGSEEFEYSWVDDFESGSAAALAGGITTLGNMTFPLPGETPLKSLGREALQAKEQAIADYFLHPVIVELNDEILEEIPNLLDEGCNTIKVFTVIPTFDSQYQEFVKAIQIAGDNNLLTMVHCEDHSLIEYATKQLVKEGKTSFTNYPESRSVASEVVATQTAVAIAESTNAPLYIVHLSSEKALQVCKTAQTQGLSVYVETRPLYLHLTSECFEEEDTAKYVGQPPLREADDVDALWVGLRDDTIHTVCTDHAPWSLEAKLAPTHTLDNLRPGVANLQTMLPLLYSEGVLNNRISLEKFVQVTSTNSAKLFGLYPRKGTIAVGSDADLVIFDPKVTKRVKNSMLKSRADYSVFEGWDVTGWPAMTIRRGEIVFKDGEVLGVPGTGAFLHREPTQKL
jgi:dihydropyrimidinase